jgi:hypothetical protein
MHRRPLSCDGPDCCYRAEAAGRVGLAGTPSTSRSSYRNLFGPTGICAKRAMVASEEGADTMRSSGGLPRSRGSRQRGSVRGRVFRPAIDATAGGRGPLDSDLHGGSSRRPMTRSGSRP